MTRESSPSQNASQLAIAGEVVAGAPASRGDRVRFPVGDRCVDDGVVLLADDLKERIIEAVASLIGRGPLEAALPRGTSPLLRVQRVELGDGQDSGREPHARRCRRCIRG